MNLAPRWARELIGYDRPPWLTGRLIDPYLGYEARLIRWAFGTSTYVQLAGRRVGARLTEGAR